MVRVLQIPICLEATDVSFSNTPFALRQGMSEFCKYPFVLYNKLMRLDGLL